MTKVKICGLTRWEDACYAADLGADALGFIFYDKSPRYVPPEVARDIIGRLPPFISTIGVFVDSPYQEIVQIVKECHLSAVQLHGNESPAFCKQFSATSASVIKAFRIEGSQLPADISLYGVDALLLDTYQAGLPGGTGTTFPWEVAIEAKAWGKIILAGGLNAENVVEAIERVRPYAVDISSGVEVSPGIKDQRLMAEFVARVKTR